MKPTALRCEFDRGKNCGGALQIRVTLVAQFPLRVMKPLHQVPAMLATTESHLHKLPLCLKRPYSMEILPHIQLHTSRLAQDYLVDVVLNERSHCQLFAARDLGAIRYSGGHGSDNVATSMHTPINDHRSWSPTTLQYPDGKRLATLIEIVQNAALFRTI